MITIGLDEAGRGPLAGPVRVGAVLIVDHSIDLRAFDDSKSLSEKRRESVYKLLQQHARDGSILVASSYARARTIDRIGIIAAQAQAMKRAIKNVLHQSGSSPHDVILQIDGNHTFGLDHSYQTQIIVHGDRLVPAISMASIIAKVERDHYMIRQSHRYPEYGLERHKGYGTAYHRAMIHQYGLSAIHRKSFCRAFLD